MDVTASSVGAAGCEACLLARTDTSGVSVGQHAHRQTGSRRISASAHERAAQAARRPSERGRSSATTSVGAASGTAQLPSLARLLEATNSFCPFQRIQPPPPPSSTDDNDGAAGRPVYTRRTTRNRASSGAGIEPFNTHTQRTTLDNHCQPALGASAIYFRSSLCVCVCVRASEPFNKLHPRVAYTLLRWVWLEKREASQCCCISI